MRQWHSKACQPSPDVMQAKSLPYWGKARPHPDSQVLYHPAAYHSLDVASVSAQWLSSDEPLLSAMARQSGLDPPLIRAWILFFVTLHDLGKWDVRFQLKAAEIATSILPLFSQADRGDSRGFNHGTAGLAWFVHEIDRYGFKRADLDTLAEWMHSVACHHGSRLLIDGFNAHPMAAPEVIRNDAAARCEWVAWARRQFLAPLGSQAASPPPPPPLLAGFCSVCDWLGSNEEYFPYQAPDLSYEDYFQASCRRADKAFSESGLWKQARRPGGMKAVYPHFQPQSVQCLIEDLPLRPGLTIVEAPTGSGKTEAALAYASRLLANGLASSIIFALPTQATANAMLERLDRDAPRIFEGANLVLAHGKARFNLLYQSLQGSQQTIEQGPQGQEEATSQCARWLAQSRKRVFLGQVGVCTIDQVLLSVLPMRHNFVRSFGVGKSVLILDEVHAYDSYMQGLLDEVLDLQRKAQGSVILLSATLPAASAARWTRQQAAPDSLPPYPLVHFFDGQAAQRFQLPPKQQAAQPLRRVQMDLRTCADALPDEGQLKEIVGWAAAGGRVALICNLVADAQLIFRRLKALFDGRLDLFHSRFRFCDRQELEQRIVKDCSRSKGGARIVVATQVIEQSLDLDFDAMWSQLCPVDLIFQRLGRLHRHANRQRPPSLQQPRCMIASPAGNDFGLHQL
ncbi:MAG: CRISPR-associated helicase/endonuclease Cas3, partial [Acidobacteriota bacterium]